ncbi:carbohydrate ABC transporter permease [Athalassotoga saccharophila]|uniref:carbohydrate ABC transporter permease n=1 Tax=Athalassotoga saccharophila TaxID=1441386 RepID=UPI001379A81E|nr:sugar ABC transporter permease [Athalassotoga saccharophila]BBJ27806.1 lactose transport system permease protein LacF [Athalassotoga saccharophila]
MKLRKFIPYIFLAPAFSIFLIFIIYPGVLGFIVSMYRTPYSFGQSVFVGFNNYLSIFETTSFLDALLRTFLFSLLVVPTIYCFSLGLALLMTSPSVKAKSVLRVFFFLPSVLSGVITALIWDWMLNYDFGFLNNLFTVLGLRNLPFLLNPTYAFLSLVLIMSWAASGFFMVIFIAGIQSIPQELYEAAEIDGASTFEKFTFITLPMLKPTSILVIILSTIQSMQLFDIPFVLTGGGPGESTTFAVEKVYNTAFINLNMGLASAMSFILFLVFLTIGILQFKVSREGQFLA